MNNIKTTTNPKGKVFSSKTKLELAKAITILRQFTADEVAEAFGTSRQIINYHMKKEKGIKRG